MPTSSNKDLEPKFFFFAKCIRDRP